MSNELLTSLLKQVSRSFYLTMRVLPGAIRPQISAAYLLARTSDTIADTELIPLDSRLQALDELRQRILGLGSEKVSFGQLSQSQALPAEKILLERCEESIGLLSGFSAADQARIRRVIDIIIGGQELDLKRFEGAGEHRIIALQNDDELDDYTYRVAGCVGEFWTHVCRAHLFPQTPLNENLLFQNGVRFGKGLQLVNILRDLPKDLRNGRCYVPETQLASSGLKPADLLPPENAPRFRPLYNVYLQKAERHLLAGWEYTNQLPRKQVRVRLACAWPILIGMRTLQKLSSENVLDPNRRIKVSRKELRRLIAQSVFLYPFAGAWRRQLGNSQL